MNTNSNNYLDKLNHISDFIVTLAENTSLSDELIRYEWWLTEQLQRVRDFKLKIPPFDFLNSINGKAITDSVLVFDSDLRVIKYSGTFSYFMGIDDQPEKDFSLLNFIAGSKHAGFFSMLELAVAGNCKCSFETVLKDYAGNYYKTTMELEPASGTDLFKMFITRPRIIQTLRDKGDFSSIMLKSLPGMDVFLYDHSYRFLMAGGKEKESHGYHDEDFIGKTLFEVFDESIQKRLYPFLYKALNGNINGGEIRISENIYSIDAIPVKDESGFTIAATLAVRNITEDKLIQKQLRKSVQEAQEADHEKSIFLANTSHEIRTPLNTIIGFADQLSYTKLDERQSRYLQLIQKASDHLLYLINEVTFLFRLDTGKIYIEKETFDLRELFKELFEQFSLTADKKGIEFDIQPVENIPLTLISDPDKIKQIISNLLVNAFKYTEHGRVSLSVKLLKQMNKNIHLEFTVADTGIGISPHDLPDIFKTFKQMNKGNIRHQESGLGLGLGICMKLVRLLKGDIEVNSTLQEGSEFKVRLPFRLA